MKHTVRILSALALMSTVACAPALRAENLVLDGYPAQGTYIDSLRFKLLTLKDEKFYARAAKREIAVSNGYADATLTYRLWLQTNAAPLVFIISGLGGVYGSVEPTVLAELLYNNGFSPVMLSNPFSWDFLLNVSETGVPGYTPQDARDLYRAFGMVVHDITNKYGAARVGKKLLLGYSLGAVQMLFVFALDQQEHRVGFETCVALSPPVNMFNALRKLDELYSIWQGLSKQEIAAKRDRAVAFYNEFREQGLAPNALLGVESRDAQFAIGVVFHMTLGEVIKAIAKRNDHGILTNTYRHFCQRFLEKEVERYGYYDYARTFIKTVHSNVWSADIPMKKLNEQVSLFSLQQALATNAQVRILHTWNDFLLTDYDRRWLKSVMKDRLTFFNCGGHLGYLYREGVQQYLVNVLRDVNYHAPTNVLCEPSATNVAVQTAATNAAAVAKAPVVPAAPVAKAPGAFATVAPATKAPAAPAPAAPAATNAVAAPVVKPPAAPPAVPPTSTPAPPAPPAAQPAAGGGTNAAKLRIRTDIQMEEPKDGNP